MESNEYMKWDTFRSVPRIKREQKSDDFYLYWLQWIKLLIFIFAHCSCLFFAFISKAVVLFLATNIGMSTYSRSNIFYLRCSMPLSNQSFDRLSCLCASLWLIQIFPDLCAFLQDVWRSRNFAKNRDRSLIWPIIFLESCRAAGLSMLTMTVFPQLDLARCVLLACATVFMVQLQYAVGHVRHSFLTSRSFCWRFGEVLRIVPPMMLFSALMSAAYLWCFFGGHQTDEFKYLLPASFVLSGIGYWESWIDAGHANGILHEAYEVKYGMRSLNPETRMCSCVLRFCCASTVLYWSLRYHTIPMGTLVTVFWKYKFWEGPRRVFILSFIVILINFYLRMCFRFLAAMRIKVVPLFHPLLLTMPALFLWSYGLCYYLPICRVNTLLHTFGLSFYCVKAVNPTDEFSDYYVTWVWLVIFVTWTYYFIKGIRVDPADEIIETMTPMMCGLDICQSLMIFHWAVGKKTLLDDLIEDEKPGDLRIVNGETDRILTLYVCATMWHETRTEMMQMLRSILKLDEEHATRLTEKNQTERIKFRLEIHIFFDDAWIDDKECGRIPNDYFKLFFETLMELTKSDEGKESETQLMMLANTSYGGRLVHRMEAGTLLFVHLKDKKLIRHKKRWSQVMYMYYLLGHRIMDSHLGVEDRQLQAENTYILAIDGDSKFEPNAVIRLLHLMNIKSDIGCACGRIHPIGEGIMVWYQKFEYAIAHWFQKAAEHVFGCVLCAPGCFSLFRASALMDDNVMHKYTKTASEPRHFVQYDQGEDRWLSTLLLKQGYRIEYAAAADAETYAPEGFEEFFNQRRRWTPSSIANTFDLLADYELASKNNKSISRLYILYQMFVIGFSMLGPAIIFTMLVYAQVSAFAVDSTTVLVYNGLPICAFILTCFCFESSTQLTFAKIASVIYAFIMLSVLIATAQQVVLETVFSPTSAFVLAMFLIFFFSSFVHPKEFSNIIFGCVFFLMIPSTYIFLSLYSLINLNVINWGTREAAAKATGGAATKETIATRLYRRFFSLNDEMSLLSRILARRFTGRLKKEELNGNAISKRIQLLEERFEYFGKNLEDSQNKENKKITFSKTADEKCTKLPLSSEEQKDLSTANRASPFEMVYRRSFWMDCEYLQGCGRGKLRLAEERFWDELIDKYLKPIETTREEQSKIASGLAALRNRIAFTIILLNALLVLAVFLLQRHKDVLSIQLTPYKGFKWTKLNETTGKFEETTDALKVDPLGMGIIFFLMGILIIQTIGMLIHRLNTLIEALHELNEVESQMFNKNIIFKDYDRVLDEARQMIDTISYERAHGADGYTRIGVGESKAQSNVLYKLQTKDY